MELVDMLLESGFERVIILDGEACGLSDAQSLLLALWPYALEESPAAAGAWVHPYYPASQFAYEAAENIVKRHPEWMLRLRDDDILVKPIFSRLPGFSQGRNTLSYVEGLGSRFHMQIMTSDLRLNPTHHLETAPHELHCGSCHACEMACPTNALAGGQFHRERCLRNWQMSGTPIPEDLRGKMGNMLLGCDICQRVCPKNPRPAGETHPTIDLEVILSDHKKVANIMRRTIGVNLAYGNRILAQACLLAGCSGDQSLEPLLDDILTVQLGLEHPSEAVVEHALWAVEQLRNDCSADDE